MELLSRFRPYVAAFAILLSPGVLGPWLQVAHVCPTMAVPGASGATGDSAHHHGAGHKERGRADLQDCICVGVCHLAGLPETRGAALITPEAAAPAADGFHAVPSSRPTLEAHALPFAHAPPLLG